MPRGPRTMYKETGIYFSRNVTNSHRPSENYDYIFFIELLLSQKHRK